MEADKAAVRALKQDRIEGVEIVEGRPGGPNNDSLRLKLKSGRSVWIDAYAMTGMTVRLFEVGELRT